jgi:hypothetical protein
MNDNYNREEEDREVKPKAKTKRVQYMLWWKPSLGTKREYGPLYDRKVAERDAIALKNLHGERNAGFEVYNPYPQREDRGYRSRR